MENNDYKKIVNERYTEEAKKSQMSLTSTMPDLNTRRLEIQNIIKYINDNDICLEVGCGNGAASVEISKIKKINLKSIDANKEMIELAKQQPLDLIKGKLEFFNQNILEINDKNLFDTVFSIRCIINLMDCNDQKQALTNIANSVKDDGKLILLEAFSDGLEELNQARNELGLESIPPAYHNLHLKKDQVINHLKTKDFELFIEDNFLSSFYFGTRVIYPAIAKANNLSLLKNSKFDNFFSYFPSYGNFSHIKILGFTKHN